MSTQPAAVAVAWESQRVEASDGVSLAVWRALREDSPRRGTALLLHGFPDTHDLWRLQVSPLVDAGYDVIAPDLRGYGESGKPRSPRAYVMPQIVDDLDRVLDACAAPGDPEEAPVVVIGHDWGAVTAWAYAGNRPHRVDKLVAISVGHPRAFVRAWVKQFPRSWYAIVFQIPRLAEVVFTAADRKVFRLLFSASPDWPDYERRLAEPGALTAGFNWYRANGRPHVLASQDSYPRVRAPTLGIIGTKEVLLTRDQMEGSEDLVDGDWSFVEIAGGHWIPLTRANEVSGAILAFLDAAPR